MKIRSNPDEVRVAYRKLARAYHPDVNADPKAHEQMAQINVAFEVLSDPVRRMEYDTSIGQRGIAEPDQTANSDQQPEAVKVTIHSRHREHRTPVYAVAFDRTTGELVSSSFDNEILWWPPNLQAPIDRMRLEGGVVSAISVPGARRVVAAGTTEQSVACWTITGPKVDVWRSVPQEWICCVAPSPDGQSLAQGGVDSAFRVVRASSGQLRFSGHTHSESVTALAWSQDSAFLATGSADASAKIWCGVTGRELYTINNIRSTVTSVAFSPNGKWLAVAAVDLSIRVFRMRDLFLAKTFFGHQRPVEALAFHPRNWLLGSASRDGSIGLWNIRNGTGHGKIDASHQPISSLAFSPDGSKMVAGGLDKVLRVWNLRVPSVTVP